MANSIVLHPSGADTNGGGFTDNYAGTWSGWHTNFAAQASYAGGTATASSGKVRITCGTNLSVYPQEGMLVYVEFQTYYSSGHYEVLSTIEDGDYFDIDLDYTDDDACSLVVVGGALKTPSVAALLAYDDQGSQLLLPANQTTQTVNEVDGSANQVLLVTAGYTMDIKGVDDTTGVLLEYDDLWPVIQAKTGSTWAANSIMFYMQSTSGDDSVNTTKLKLDKIIFDGNSLVPKVVQTGDSSNDYVNLYCGDFTIKGSLSTGYGWLANAYNYVTSFIEYAGNIYITDCAYGYSPNGSRALPKIKSLHINNCSVAGLYCGLSSVSSTLASPIKKVILSNNAIGMNNARYSVYLAHSITFVNNVIDILANKYSTESATKTYQNFLIYNDNASGKIVSCDDNTLVSVEFKNCVLGVANGAVIDYGITSTKTECVLITSDPFVNKANGDYRLKPEATEFDKVYDWETGEFYGALGPAEPASSGGGGFVAAGVGRIGIQEC